MSEYINKIVNGNSLEILKKIPNKTFDLVFADPPYNLQIGEKLRTLMPWIAESKMVDKSKN